MYISHQEFPDLPEIPLSGMPFQNSMKNPNSNMHGGEEERCIHSQHTAWGKELSKLLLYSSSLLILTEVNAKQLKR